jgi:hypothetical protein
LTTRGQWLREKAHHDARAQWELAERLLLWAAVGFMLGGLLMWMVRT